MCINFSLSTCEDICGFNDFLYELQYCKEKKVTLILTLTFSALVKWTCWQFRQNNLSS